MPSTLPASAAVPPAPEGNGYAVQVAAVNNRPEAEMIARRLMSKGYRAFLVEPAAADGMYRVRVGKYKDRREAEAVLRRLEKEEQLKGLWIPPTR